MSLQMNTTKGANSPTKPTAKLPRAKTIWANGRAWTLSEMAAIGRASVAADYHSRKMGMGGGK